MWYDSCLQSTWTDNLRACVSDTKSTALHSDMSRHDLKCPANTARCTAWVIRTQGSGVALVMSITSLAEHRLQMLRLFSVSYLSCILTFQLFAGLQIAASGGGRGAKGARGGEREGSIYLQERGGTQGHECCSLSVPAGCMTYMQARTLTLTLTSITARVLPPDPHTS